MALTLSSFIPSSPTLKGQLWLVAAVLASCLAERWSLPLLQLCYPLLLLIYLRTQPIRRGFPLAWLALSVTWGVAMADFAPFMAAPEWLVTMFVSFALGLLPYLADRLLQGRLSPVWATLVLPCAMLSADFLRHQFDPTGSYGMLGYGPGADHPLAQFSAIAGIDGVSFVLAWAVSIAATWFMQRKDSPHIAAPIRNIAVCFSMAMLLLLAWGLVQQQSLSNSVTQPHNSPQPVRIASIARHHDPAITDQQNLADWLALSRQQAQLGADIIVWAEGALMIAADQEDAAVRAGQALAKSEGVHLVMAVFHLNRTFADKRHNKLIWIDSQGLIRTVYHKNHGQFAEQTIAGDGKLAVVDTPWGRFGLTICWDADFPNFIRQASQQGVQALLNPSYDYPAVVNGRAEIARYRAIENGMALIRPNNNGLNLITDSKGRVLARQRNQGHEPVVLMSELQLHAQPTAYRYVGNALSMLSLIGLAALILLGWRHPHHRQADTPAVVPVVS